jgi:hypothetical protein
MQNTDSDEKITSVDQFVKKITGLNKVNDGIDYIYNRVPMYYRGQANHDWELQPGLFRDSRYQGLKQVLQEFEQNYPEEIYDATGKEIDRFDEITKMQHYGFPTNFLDFTENPLVALFFACADKTQLEKDGAVFVCNSFLFNVDDKIKAVEKIQDINDEFLRRSAVYDTPHVYNSKSKIHYLDLCNTDPESHKLKQYRPHFFYGTKTMERPRKQKSIFLVFYAGPYSQCLIQDKIKSISKKHNLYFRELEFSIKNVNARIINNSRVLKINKEYKKTILKELDMLKINKVELFPEMEYYSSYLKGDLWL